MKKILVVLLSAALLLQPMQSLATGAATRTVTPVSESESVDVEQPSESESESTDVEQPSESESVDVEQPSESESESTDVEQPSESESSTEAEQPENVPFDCYALGTDGVKVDGYWSVEDSAWYLFVPSTVDLAELDIYYTGRVEAVTKGTIDEEMGCIENAFTASGDQVYAFAGDKTVHNIIVMQSELPSVYITLSGVTLDEVHAGSKDAKYKQSSIFIGDPDGVYDLKVEGNVEFKGRGNSTWTFFHKKGYQIKFDDKTSVLGMEKAKKWVLLANAADETLMHNMLAYGLASDLEMEYVTEFEYVDLWVDGEYRGNYILGEKIETGSGRVELEYENGTIFEHDQGFYYEEDFWLFNALSGKYFTLKETNADTDDAEIMQEILDAFQNSMDALMTYLYTTEPENVTLEELAKLIDVDSVAKYYLINEFTCNRESTASSFYWYKDGLKDVLHAGPIWDFDSSMGNEKEETPYYVATHVLFNRLLNCPAFYERTVEIYEANKDAFTNLVSNIEYYKETLGVSVDMNYIRWNVWGEENPKVTLNDYSASYEEALAKLTAWLSARCELFEVPQFDPVFAFVDEECNNMEISFDTDKDYTSVKYAVWSDVNGQDDLRWYEATKNTEGTWVGIVDLSGHQVVGKYTIHAYGVLDGINAKRGEAHSYVEKVNETTFSGKVSENGYFIETEMTNVGMYDELEVRVSCETEENEDYKVYKVYKVDKQPGYKKSCLIELRDHDEIGLYHVQFYGKAGDEWVLIGEVDISVDSKTWPLVNTTVDAQKKTMKITVDNADMYEGLEFSIWGEINGKNDVASYEATQDENGVWSVLVDLDSHGENGVYQIEVFGKQGDEKKGIAFETVEVENIVFSSDVISVYRLYNSYTQEHLLTASEEEANQLMAAGWGMDGVAWKAPKSGVPVYRLYNPYDDWHTYSVSKEEIDILTGLGWSVDGIVFSSTEAENRIQVYRLFNPYEQKNYHLLTASEEEKSMLMNLGWKMDGVALNAVLE